MNWPLTLYFDGECPLCAREIKLLRGHAVKDQLLFVDISNGAFDAKALGFTFEQKFEVYMVDFHGFRPAKDYRFVTDGAPKPPPV